MNDIYINYNKILSYPFLLAFLLSDRGNGKTYGFKKWAINDWIKNKKEFIYLRRYKSELKDCGKLFSDIIHEYPNYEITYKAGTFYIQNISKEDKPQIFGYAIALSTALVKKSVPYPHVNKIGFDEFIILRSHLRYLPSEVTMFLEFFETVARLRDDIRVIFMANRVSAVNPYFLYFNIRINSEEFLYLNKQHILVCQSTSSKYRQLKAQTKFGELIAGTQYDEYAFNDGFIEDNFSLIENKTNNSILKMIIKYNNKFIGLWTDYVIQIHYFSYKIGECPVKLAIERNEMNEEYDYMGRNGWGVDFLRRIFKSNACRYENIEIKNLMFDIMKKIGF